MSRFTIDEMCRLVPEGQRQVFEPTLTDPVEERFFQIWQNWDYYPGRLEWLNRPGFEGAPRRAMRNISGVPVSVLLPPDVIFKGPSKDVVDFYDLNKDAPFISDKLFKLIEEVDPGSLEHVEFSVRAKDAELPFHAIMPRRSLDVIDPQRTKVVIEDEPFVDRYFRKVQFPDGIVFDNAALRDVSNFAAIDILGWYWSKDLIELAQARGVRGLYAKSKATSGEPEFARL